MSAKLEPTGIDKLDKALGGGLPLPSGIILFGPMGSGKTALGRQLVANFLEKDYAVIYVTVEEEAEVSDAALANMGVDTSKYTKKGQLFFLDLFSEGVKRLNSKISKERNSIMRYTFLELLRGQLYDLIREFSLRNLARKQLGFMDSMTTLIMSASDAEIYQFSQTFQNLLKFVNGIGIGTLHENVLKKEAEDLYLGFTDGIIGMTRKNELTGKDVERGGYLKVIRMKGQNFSTRPVYYSIESNKIMFPDIPAVF